MAVSTELQRQADITIVDPRTGELVGELTAAGETEVAEALAGARAALPAWRATPPAERGLALRRAAGLVSEREDDLAEANAKETGRPVGEALAGIRAGIDTLLQYSELAPVHRGHSLNGSLGAIDFTRAEPRGVVVALTPWNDPVAVALGLIGAALVTGNTVVHKPSERCPHLGTLLGDVLAQAFPPGVMQSLVGGAGTGAALTASRAVDVIAHVGSTATGLAIARAAVVTGTHVIRENGGNDPVWAAEQAAIGAFANSGQICTSVERIFVHADVADAFVAALMEQARVRNDGDGLAPLVDRRLRDAVHEQVQASVAAGARVLVGGEVPEGPGSFYPATVIADCADGMPLMTEETFGPVAPVSVVDSFDEGLRRAGADRYGLAATVLTGSMENAYRAVDALAVGTVKVNAVFGGAPGGAAQPRRASGSGFGYGPELLDEMTTVKVVHLQAAGSA
jgi:acyl-CoA reductase-like NAD-dependent aldehyde dehydrogenase